MRRSVYLRVDGISARFDMKFDIAKTHMEGRPVGPRFQGAQIVHAEHNSDRPGLLLQLACIWHKRGFSSHQPRPGGLGLDAGQHGCRAR
jgi:hypothetical protein